MLRHCQCAVLHNLDGAAALWLSASAASRALTLQWQLPGIAKNPCVRRSSNSTKGQYKNQYRSWTESDVEIYRRLHAEGKSAADIACALGRTPGALGVKKHLGMKVVSKELVYWTPREDEQLRRLRAEGRSMQDIADILGQPRNRVTSRLQLIEGRKVTKVQHDRWSAERIDLLIRMESEGHKISHIASVLELPQRKVRYKLAALRKGASQSRSHRRYTQDEDETLSSLLGSGNSWKAVLDALPHRGKSSLTSRATYLGIRAPIRAHGLPWTTEDTLKLTQLRTASKPWDFVATELGRTAYACRTRWRELQSKSASLEKLPNSHQ